MSDLSVSVSAAGGHAPPVVLPEAAAKVTARGLNFYYGENQALKNISLTLGTNRRHRLHRTLRLRQVRPCCGFSTGCTISIPASAPPAR